MKVRDVSSVVFARSGSCRADDAAAEPIGHRRVSGSGARPHRAGLFATLLAAFALLALAPSALAAEPTLTVDPVTTHGITTAKVSGTVTFDEEANGGSEGYWYFQYCENASPGECTEASSWSNGPEAFSHTLPAGSTAVPVEETLTGLKAGTEYAIRLAALPFSTFSEVHSEEAGYESFTTDPAPIAPTATVDAATSVSYTSAQVQGAVDPEGGNEESGGAFVPIHWSLELSSDGSSFSPVASGDLTTGEGAESPTAVDVPSSPAELTELTPGHTYSYKLVVTYAGQAPVESATETFETLAVTKPSIENLAVTDVTPDSATFEAEVDPNGADPAFDATWEFTCVPECHGAKGAPLNGTVAGTSEPIDADAVALEPNTEYTVTLKATNAGGSEEASTTFTTPAIAPGVRDFGAGPVHSESASLNGEVNPHNSASVYWFEWGAADCAANPCQAIPVGEDAEAGSGGKYLHVSELLSGLSPSTTYHFRLVVQSAAGITEGLDQTFTTPAAESAGCANEARRVEQNSTHLPDCRTYELVSPIDKNGADVVSSTGRIHAATDGNALIFASLAGFADAQGSGVDVDYLSERSAVGPTGWSTHAITPQQGPLTIVGIGGVGATTGYDAEFTPDLSRGIYRYFGARPEDANVQSVPNLYLRDDLRIPGPGNFDLLTQSVTPLNPSFPNTQRLKGASTDLSHVIFQSRYNLTADAVGGSLKLYEWESGTVRLAGILPNGAAASASGAGGVPTESLTYSLRTITADGSRILFTDPNTGSLYARIDGAVTVQLNASERLIADAPQAATYETASTDGARIFFTTNEALIDTDVNGDNDLYMWERATHDEIQDVTVDATSGTFTLDYNGQVTAPLAFDATADAVKAAIVALPNIGSGDIEVTGGPGALGGGTPYAVRFTGAFAGANVAEIAADASGLSGGAATAGAVTTQPVRNLTLISRDTAGGDAPNPTGVIGASEDGSYIYFLAFGQLLREAGSQEEFQNGAGIYAWHDGELRYIGWLLAARDIRVNSTTSTQWNGNGTLTSRVTPDGLQMLFMSHSDEGLKGRGGFVGADHGSTCTYDPLPSCREFYVYNADGGTLRCASCHVGAPATGDALAFFRENNGGSGNTYHLSHSLTDDGRFVFFGTVDALVPQDTNNKLDVYEYDSVTETQRLLSSGTDPHDSYFMEATPSGSDVYFTTKERLSAWDIDEAYDVYDARIGGGFPEPPPTIAPCGGESCRTAAPSAPSVNAPGSGSLVGSGNPKPIRCPKSKKEVRKGSKVRCVKKHYKHKRRANSNRRAAR